MRDLYQVLREKQGDLERVRREIEALRFVAPLLTEEKQSFQSSVEQSRLETDNNRWPLKVS